MKEKRTFQTIDEYIEGFPPETRDLLQKLHSVIRDAAPQASETISYQMPTFRLNGNLVHFAAFQNHIGFYPTPSGIEKFQAQLSSYKNAKGSVQFPITKPLPYDLIAEIVKFRVEENLLKTKSKKS